MMCPLANSSHTLWLLGHLAYIESLVINSIMLGRTNPLEHWKTLFDSAEISTEASQYPTFQEVLSECRSQRMSTFELIESFEEHELDAASQNSPNEALELFGTYRNCFQYTADHWLMHRGQFALARRAAGVTNMWY